MHDIRFCSSVGRVEEIVVNRARVLRNFHNQQTVGLWKSVSSSMAALHFIFVGLLVVASQASSLPKGVKLYYPPFNSDLVCKFNESLTDNIDPKVICKHTSDASGQLVVLSYDNDVLSTRYQYKKLVQFYKKKSKYAASFSTSFVVNIVRDSERAVKRVFGGGIAFAITPTLVPGDSTESIGLFEINPATGMPVEKSSPMTVAVEIDTSTPSPNTWDFPQVPHLGLDINSLKSAVSTFLWNQTEFVNHKVGYFIDYDAKAELLQVRVQNITTNGSLNKKKAKLYLSYPKFQLSNYVNDYSYVGFSSRVPVTDEGVYRLYSWKFETTWITTSKHY